MKAKLSGWSVTATVTTTTIGRNLAQKPTNSDSNNGGRRPIGDGKGYRWVEMLTTVTMVVTAMVIWFLVGRNWPHKATARKLWVKHQRRSWPWLRSRSVTLNLTKHDEVDRGIRGQNCVPIDRDRQLATMVQSMASGLNSRYPATSQLVVLVCPMMACRRHMDGQKTSTTHYQWTKK